MANKSILDVDLIETTAEEDSFYVNSGQSLRQVKKKNVKFDYNTHVENKPSINDVELTGNKTLDELGIGSATEVTSLNEQIQTNKQDIADLRQSKADVMVHTAKGSHITVNNSAEAFFEGLKIYGKSEQVQTNGYQLFDASKIATKSAGGATVTNNGDGSFTISGSGNLSAECTTMYQLTHEETTRFLKAGTLKIASSNIRPKVFVGLYYDGRWSSSYGGSVSGTGELDITEELLQKSDLMMRFGFSDNIGTPIVPGTVKPMVYQDGDGTWESFTGGKPSPSMEYKQDPESSGDGGTIGLEVFGKNLYPKGDISTDNLNYKYTGIIPWTGKQNILLNFSAKTNVENGQLFIGASYYDKDKKELGGNGLAEPCGTTFKQYHNVKFTGTGAASGANVDLRNVRYIEMHFGIRNNSATHIDYKDIVITDSEGVEFDGYQPPQTLSIPTPNGLPGLPNTSTGEYHNDNRDEIDFGSGKHIQKISKLVLNGSEGWILGGKKEYRIFTLVLNDNAGGVGMCDCFPYVNPDGSKIGFSALSSERLYLITGHETVEELKAHLAQHPVTVYYKLKTPIETDIPEEVMKAYRELYTNSPTTVIQNDSDAYMEVDYATYTHRANKEDVKDLVNSIEDLQSYVGYYGDNVVGLQVDYKNKTFKRLAGAKYLKPGADFDKYKMFGGRRKCIVDDAGKIVAWHGDSKYVEDGSLGQVMVYQPAFYYRIQPLDLEPIDTGIGHHLRKANYYVSDIPLPGFKRHPSFFDANGDEIDYTLTSAYEGNIFAAEDSNLLTDGEQEITNNEYSIKAYTPAIPLSEGVEYEVSVCVTPGKGVEKLCHYLSDGYILMAETPMVGNEKQTVTAKFVAKYYDGKKPENDLKYAKYCIFKNSNNVAITEPTTIHWVKIKRAVSNSYLKKDEQVANFDTDKLSSIAGVKPASGVKQKLTRANAEKLANNRGTGWYIDTIKSVSAEQLLMMIEMGTMNMQDAIGEGVVNIADNTSYNCSSITGSTASIGNGTGQAAQTVNTKGDASTTETADGKTSVCWRGKENFWGNIWKFVYGINIWGNGKMGGGQPYICKDFNFVENKNSDNYEGAGFTATNANGYISAMGYSTNYDWLFIASECLGNSLLPVGDYTDTDNNLNGYNIAISDGGWNFGDFAGAFCWYLAGGADYRVRDIGGRIIHIPTKGSEPYKSNIVSWKQEVSK